MFVKIPFFSVSNYAFTLIYRQSLVSALVFIILKRPKKLQTQDRLDNMFKVRERLRSMKQNAEAKEPARKMNHTYV